MTTVNVLCPPGVGEGMPIGITHPHTGQSLQVIVPPGVVAGMQFQVQLPPSAPQNHGPPVAIGVPVGAPGQGGGHGGYGGSPPPYAASVAPGSGYGAPAPGGYGGRPPDIRANKHAWFDFFDRDRSGSLDRREINEALVETFGAHADPSRRSGIASAVDACWAIFDIDLNGSVSRAEFVRNDGLADTIVANLAF